VSRASDQYRQSVCFQNIKINERVAAQFQAQAFDIMNMPFLGVPDSILDEVASGTGLRLLPASFQ